MTESSRSRWKFGSSPRASRSSMILSHSSLNSRTISFILLATESSSASAHAQEHRSPQARADVFQVVTFREILRMPFARLALAGFGRDECERNGPLAVAVSALHLFHHEMFFDGAQRGARKWVFPVRVGLEGPVGEAKHLHRQPGLERVVERDDA